MHIHTRLRMAGTRIQNLLSAITGDEPPRSDDVTTLVSVTSVNGKPGPTVVLFAADISDLASTYVPLSQRGANNGVATLDGSGKLNLTQVPTLAIGKITTYVSQSAMLADTNEQGDTAIRTDENKTYIKGSGTAGTMADWILILTPGGGSVVSVNGHAGVVVLTAADITGFGAAAYTNSYLDLDNLPTIINNRRVLTITSASGTVNIDWSLYDVAHCILTGNVSFIFSGATPEQGCILRLKQDNVGGRTVTLPGAVRVSTDLPGFTASTIGNKIDRVGFIYDSVDLKYDLVSVLKGLS